MTIFRNKPTFGDDYDDNSLHPTAYLGQQWVNKDIRATIEYHVATEAVTIHVHNVESLEQAQALWHDVVTRWCGAQGAQMSL